MRRKIHLASAAVCVVVVGVLVQRNLPADLRLFPFVLAFAAYRCGTLIERFRTGGQP